MVQIRMAEIYAEKAYKIWYCTYFKWANETRLKKIKSLCTLRILNEASANLGLRTEESGRCKEVALEERI